MNEAEAIGALSDIAENGATYTGLWLSVTFANMTAGYIVGKAMSRFQYWAVTSLYFLTAFFTGSASLAHVQAWVRFNNSQATVYRDLWLPPYDVGVGAFLAGGTLIALYFMYNVRNSEDS